MAKTPHIEPLLPELSPARQKQRRQLAAAVSLMRTTVPAFKDSPGGAAFGHAYDQIGAAVVDYRREFERETARGEDMDRGAFYLTALVTIYGKRAHRFFQTGVHGRPMSEDELFLFSSTFNELEKDPSLAVEIAQAAGVHLDMMANAKWLTLSGVSRTEAAATLIEKLWALCVHPKLILHGP